MSKSPSEPLSERRLDANRANAALSTGPRTPEGKAASSRNAPEAHRPPLGRPVVRDQKVAHGFRSSSFAVVRLEDLDEIAGLKADAVGCYQPVNAQELIAVERIALAQQQLFRAARLEAGLFTDALNESLDRLNRPIKPMDESLVGTGDIDICKAQNRNYCLAEGFHRMAKESNVWSLFLRYQAQADRMYRRALDDFDRLKSLRAQMPNEPNVGTQPEEKEQLPPLEEINPRCRPEPESAVRPAPRAPAPPPSVQSVPAAPPQSAPRRPSPLRHNS